MSSFKQVAEDDAIFRADAAAASPPDAVAEEKALEALFKDESICEACETTLKARWQSVCLAKWSQWHASGNTPQELVIGKEVVRVVRTLDAPHLLATGIYERIAGGNTAACFGLATLITNMKIDDTA